VSRWGELSVSPVDASRPLVLGRGALWAFGATAFEGVIGAWVPLFRDGSGVGRSVVASLGCAVMLALGARWSRGDRRGVVTYFALQSALAALVVVLTEGRSALVLMPLISQACLVLPVGGVLLSVVAGATLFLSSLARPTPALLAGQGLSFVVAAVFTWLFTGVAMRERQSRMEVERLAASLADANHRLEALTLERERVRLAHEIHDGLGHALTAARVQLEAARVMFEREPARAKAGLEVASRLIQEGLDDVRQSVRALREEEGAGRPLVERLQRLCEDGLPVAELVTEGPVRRLAPSVEHALFRAAQEGLTNVRRHAEAKTAWVRVRFEGPRVQLSVEDDGRGPREAQAGVGLTGVQSRAQRHGGTSALLPRPEGGAVLRFEVNAAEFP